MTDRMTNRTVYLLPTQSDGHKFGDTAKAVLAEDLRVGDVLGNGTPVTSVGELAPDEFLVNHKLYPAWMLVPLRSLAPEPEPGGLIEATFACGPMLSGESTPVTEPEPELPRIPDASKLTPGTVIRNDTDGSDQTLVEYFGEVSFMSVPGWSCANGGHISNRSIQNYHRLVSLGQVVPDPRSQRIPDASRLTSGTVIRRDDGIAVTLKQRLDVEWWVTTSGGHVMNADIENYHELVSLGPPPRPQVGDVVGYDDAERLHIDGLVIRDNGGYVAEWDGTWEGCGTEIPARDDHLRFPVKVLHVPEVTT